MPAAASVVAVGVKLKDFVSCKEVTTPPPPHHHHTTTALTHWSCSFMHWKKFTQWPIGSVHCSHIGNTTHCLLEYCIESFHTQRRESCGHTQSVNVLNPQNCRRVHSSAKYLCASLEPSEPLGRRILTNMGTAASPDGLPS